MKSGCEKHTMLSPSKAHRYVRCPVSVVRAVGVPDDTSEFAEEGRLAHELAAAILTGQPEPDGVPDDMRAPVLVYVDTVKAMSAGAAVVRVEWKVDLTSILDEGEKGTVDFMAIVGNELQIHDLKYGRGEAVSAEGNEQLILYALGALPVANCVADIDSVRLVIHQPRLGIVSEVAYPVAEMSAFRDKFRSLVKVISGLFPDDPANPGERQCRFCPKGVKENCRELADVAKTAVASLGDATDSGAAEKKAAAMDIAELAGNYALLPLVGIWVKAVEGAAMSRMLAGEVMPNFKLVEGRAGNRQWSDDGEAEKWMKKMRLKVDEMYTKKVISPTAAEKLLKDNARKWEKLQPLVTRTPPKPAIVPESDKRPAMLLNACTADDFDDLTETGKP